MVSMKAWDDWDMVVALGVACCSRCVALAFEVLYVGCYIGRKIWGKRVICSDFFVGWDKNFWVVVANKLAFRFTIRKNMLTLHVFCVLAKLNNCFIIFS